VEWEDNIMDYENVQVFDNDEGYVVFQNDVITKLYDCCGFYRKLIDGFEELDENDLVEEDELNNIYKYKEDDAPISPNDFDEDFITYKVSVNGKEFYFRGHELVTNIIYDKSNNIWIDKETKDKYKDVSTSLSLALAELIYDKLQTKIDEFLKEHLNEEMTLEEVNRYGVEYFGGEDDDMGQYDEDVYTGEGFTFGTGEDQVNVEYDFINRNNDDIMQSIVKVTDAWTQSL
jgi:hypothetical protein